MPTVRQLIDQPQDAENRSSEIEAVKLVKEFVMGTPEVRDDPSKIIEGWGWNHMGWAGRAWPTAVSFLAYTSDSSLIRASRPNLTQNLSFAGARSSCKARMGMLFGYPQQSSR
jgi:hypothetical protein